MRRTGIVAGVCGVVLAAGAIAWSPVAVPRLVKLPTNTNLSLQYKGSLVTFVNARTGATLARPTSVPLTVDRQITAVPGSSTSSVAVMTEHLVAPYSGKSITENNVYAVNRRSMCNVTDTHACTFAVGNRSATTGSYYLTLPMNLSTATRLQIWKPETGTTYPLASLPAAKQHPSSIDGLGVLWFNGVLTMTPVAPWEQKALVASGLPSTVSPTAVEAQLSAAGISVPALTRALLPVLTPAETRQVTTVLATPVHLNYYAFGSGLVAAEPTTGAEIDLKNIVDGRAVKPSTSGMSTLISVMSHHTSVPGVPAAIAELRRLAAAAPQPVFELRYSQTPASIALMVSKTKSQLGQIHLATTWIPIGLGVLALALLVLAGYRRFWPRTPRASVATGHVAPSEATVERHAA